jgi:dephospho-CoA kinase
MARKGCERRVAEEWVSSQMDMDEKVRHASRVIENDGPLEDLHDKVLAAWSEIMEPRKDQG